jgi:hypothetical protein
MAIAVVFVLFSIIFFSILIGGNSVNALSGVNDTMTVEVDLIGFNVSEPGEGVGIEVQDYIYLGNVTKENLESDELKVYINNTGNVDVTVTPELVNSSEKIFSYLYFREHKTSNGTAVIPQKIGNYSLDIDKPSSGKSIRSASVYMHLNLTNYPDKISDEIGHRTKVLFIAMPQ